jgi:predicted DNA-binding transcriptional regulator AlpA
MTRPVVTGRRILSYADLQALGIRFSRVHLRRLETSGKFPKHITLGGGNFIGWFEGEIDQHLDRLTLERNSAPRKAAELGPAESGCEDHEQQRLSDGARPGRRRKGNGKSPGAGDDMKWAP